MFTMVEAVDGVVPGDQDLPSWRPLTSGHPGQGIPVGAQNTDRYCILHMAVLYMPFDVQLTYETGCFS